MNKKMNTVLFILGATLFNVLTAVISFVVLTLLYARFAMDLPETSRSWGVMFILLASVVISFFVYRFLLKYLLKKIDADKYFYPLFAGRYKKK
jgi:drug/metabolite transporter (DMT)-like permease